MLKLITKSFIKSVSKRGSQHDRAQTWINVFNLIGSHGGCDMVKNIPDSLTFPFTVWMAENGFYPCTKKNFLVMKRGNEVAKISMHETEQGFAMNDICQKRFLSFCRAYLNRDKNYIDQLRMRGMAKMNQLSYQMVA